MSNPFVYDKAKYHFESVEELGLPIEHAYHHTAFYLRWLIDNNLMSEFFTTEAADILATYKRGDVDILKVYEWWDCCLIDDMLSERGNEFSQHYFNFESGAYLSDYVAALQNNLESEFLIEFNEANYQLLKKVIDQRYADWTNPPVKQPKWKFW